MPLKAKNEKSLRTMPKAELLFPKLRFDHIHLQKLSVAVCAQRFYVRNLEFFEIRNFNSILPIP